MGKSKASRAAKERLEKQLRCTNSGQFAKKDDEGNETDQMCVVEELTEALLAARQNEQDALASAQDAVDTMQMMSGTEQNEGELLLLDHEGQEISVADHFNRETTLRDVDPEEDDPEDGPEVFEIDVREESGEEIFAAESLRFLKDSISKWQPRKITQRGESGRTEKRRKHAARLRQESATAPGQKSILKERGKEKGFGGHVLNKICLGCEKRSPRGDTESDFVRSDTCCMYYVLSQEPDFLEQKPWLHETVMKQAGFHFMLYPKYHCELNYIEMVWGYIKAYHRRNCTYSFKDLDGADGLVKTLNERIPISFVRRASNHCLRYMSFYRAGLHGPELEFAVRKYRSHRAINPQQKAMIRVSFEEYKQKKRTRK